MNIKILLIFMVALFISVNGVSAVAADFSNLNATCFGTSTSTAGVGDNRTQFTLIDECVGGSQIDYINELNLSLGALMEDEFAFGVDYAFVDVGLRPDLDAAAEITLSKVPFAIQPVIKKDGVTCGDCSIILFNAKSGELTFNVTGFSNYTVTGRQDFVVHTDDHPELKQKVYQTIDLGDGNRMTQFACTVLIFADDAENNLVLVQSNPEREVQGRLFGDVDTNQPESLGYFPTQNGVANVYFRNDLLVGYTDFQYVVKCQSNATQLIYEQTISPVYSPLGREFAARAVWFTTDNNNNNSSMLMLYLVVFMFGLWFLGMYIRSVRLK